MVYELGPFRLDTDGRVLMHQGVATALGARAVAVLTALVGRAGEFVDKSVIVDAAWPGVVVEEANLAVQVSAIRRVLASVPQGDQWIETLARRGYRYVGPVARPADEPSTVNAREQAPPRPAHIAAPHPNNLPARVSSFVGRIREIADIERLLASNRLVTLVGVGGVGKTRVALQVAGQVIGQYPDGVWFVELGSIADAALVPTAVAQVLEVQERGGEPLLRTLCRHLRNRQLLLVLDTCEHVVAAAADLTAAVLADAPNTRILATSREALNVAGEQQVPLQPLSLPDVAATADEVARAEAVQLFVDRARLQQSTFTLTADVVASVGSLCTSLEGIPLAIELAAARLSSLSVGEIGRRLDDRFGLLAAGPRASPPRQRTLRATLDWSYDLLTDDEQRALQRLAVFAGGFTLEAARRVIDDRTTDAATLDVLAALVGRSLVVADTTEAGTRYRLLDTMREYCLEKLEIAGERQMASRRHACYFRDLFDDALEEWLRGPDVRWTAVYQAERDNVRAALDWALSAQGNAEIGVGVAANSGPAWLWWSLRSEALSRIQLALSLCSARTSTRTRGRLWLWLGVLHQFSDAGKWVKALHRAVVLHRRAGDALGTGYSYMRLAGALARTGRLDLAQRALDRARPLLANSSVRSAMAPYFHAAGFVRKLAGDLVDARDHYEKSLALYRSAGMERDAAQLCGNLADTNWALGALDAAADGFREAIELMRGSNKGTPLVLGVNLTNLAGVLVEQGAMEEALTAAREGLELRKPAGYAWGALDHLALRAALVGRWKDAARVAGYADAVFAAKGVVRQANEARARARLDGLLHGRFETGERVRLLAEGATMIEEDACRLALAS